VALDKWTTEAKDPPPSAYPFIGQKTLVDWHQESTGFPAIPGVKYPDVIQQPSATYFGPNFLTKGIITIEPPQLKGEYVVLVPKSDKDGNDIGTLLVPDVAVPLATYTGWNLRHRNVGAEGMLASLQGSYIPFPKSEKERKETGDPRLSIEERYETFEKYRSQFEKTCATLEGFGYLLHEDVERLVEGLEKKKDFFKFAK
jgi:hypothetical protein